MSSIINALNWRYAAKAYDTDKKLSEDQVNTLIESIRLSPSSFGLQPYKVIHVKDPETREKLKAAAWGQGQITDASEFLVFAVSTNYGEKDVDAFIQQTATTRNMSVETLVEYASMIKGSVASRTPEQLITWHTNQAYIALGVLLTAAAIENIDASPMEGFDAKQFDEILGLAALNLKSVVVVALGYRSSDDNFAGLAKVRVSKDNLVIVK